MNIPLAGPNVQLAPGADLGDDRLDLVTVSERERKLVEEYLRARPSTAPNEPLTRPLILASSLALMQHEGRHRLGYDHQRE